MGVLKLKNEAGGIECPNCRSSDLHVFISYQVTFRQKDDGSLYLESEALSKVLESNCINEDKIEARLQSLWIRT